MQIWFVFATVRRPTASHQRERIQLLYLYLIRLPTLATVVAANGIACSNGAASQTPNFNSRPCSELGCLGLPPRSTCHIRGTSQCRQYCLGGERAWGPLIVKSNHMRKFSQRGSEPLLPPDSLPCLPPADQQRPENVPGMTQPTYAGKQATRRLIRSTEYRGKTGMVAVGNSYVLYIAASTKRSERFHT